MIAASGPERIWWIILILLVLSFLAGTWLNRLRAKKLARWLQEGLVRSPGNPHGAWCARPVPAPK